jgi:hypothetical protein
LAVLAAGPVERLELQIYSVAFVRVATLQAPGGGPGWLRIPLQEALQGLPAGTYVYRVQAFREQRQSPPLLGKFLLLR